MAVERNLDAWPLGRRTWARTALVGIIAFSGALTAPLMIPLLSPPQYEAYTRLIGRTFPNPRNEPEPGPMPQFLSDQFGHRERVAEVARIYRRLPRAERMRATLMVREGCTWAVFEFLHPEYGLPKPLTNEADVALWFDMVPRGEPFLAVCYERAFLERYFRSVEEVPPSYEPIPWANPDRFRPVHVCRGLKVPWKEFWAATRCYSDGAEPEVAGVRVHSPLPARRAQTPMVPRREAATN